ncbi:MAG TPA: SagB family peptide dehydrogenase [Thermoanaerobaculia bacterium]
MDRLARNPEILICWSEGRVLVEDLGRGENFFVSPETILLLDLFERPRTPEAAVRALPDYNEYSLRRSIRTLVRLGLLIPWRNAQRRRSRLKAWKENLASAHYHVASRDIHFLKTPSAIDRFLRARIAAERQPPRFKRYRGVGRRRLPRTLAPKNTAGDGLEQVLAARRTVREFGREALPFEDLAAVIRGTWGRTGWLDGGPLGRLALKTSPSAGSLHPIECYVLAWNVSGLASALYHYDVASDELRRLRTGDLRRAAVEAASGQSWIGRAAFLCVMTAVFERTLWKYEFESAYRVLWLDAGHLAQTFCLLATSRGLGPFTTAAIQDSYIEKLIGLDGIKEFPVYLCGAGVPAKRLRPSLPG